MKAETSTKTINFDQKKIENIVAVENKFILDLFSTLSIPISALRPDSDDEEDDQETSQNGYPQQGHIQNKPTRAKSLQELQQRLEKLKKNKKKLTHKDKLLKKGLKNRMKKKSKQDERNAEQKLKRAAKLTNGEVKKENGEEHSAETEEKNVEAKPVFNKEDKMVFSKIDFANLGKKKIKKHKKDPKQLLNDLKKQKEMVQKLEKDGEVEKAVQIKEKTAWKNALAKAQGEKVKDDPDLLKKTVKKQEQKQRSSQKKWKARVENVEKKKEERQKKRQDNIDKRKKDKKTHKLKKAVKKGKVIPGY